MSRHSRVAPHVSPLLWLVPLPFALAMCVPVDLPRVNTPTAAQRIAAAPADRAASAPAGHRTSR